MGDSQRSRQPWWMVPGAVTLLLLAFNSPLVLLYVPRLFQLKKRAFSLHMEMNFAVWWSAILILLSAAIFYEIASRAPQPRRRAYLELSILMLVLLIDEIGSLHEWLSGIGGWLALAPFGVVCLLLLGDSLRLLWRYRDSRTVARVVLVSAVLLFVVVAQEWVEHNLVTKEWRVRYGRFLEEATEIIAFWVMLLAAVRARQGSRWGGSLAAVVPDPTRMARLMPILVCGFLAHLVASQFVFVRVGIWDGRPSAIYPVIVFCLLAFYAFWVPHHRSGDSSRSLEVRGFWSAVGLFFLACSLGSMQNLWGVLSRTIPGLHRQSFYEKTPVWIGLLLVVFFIGLVLWQRRDKRLLLLLALPLAMWVRVDLEHAARKHLAGGLFAGICAVALMRPDSWAPSEGSIESPAERPNSDLET